MGTRATGSDGTHASSCGVLKNGPVSDQTCAALCVTNFQVKLLLDQVSPHLSTFALDDCHEVVMCSPLPCGKFTESRAIVQSIDMAQSLTRHSIPHGFSSPPLPRGGTTSCGRSAHKRARGRTQAHVHKCTGKDMCRVSTKFAS